MLVDLYRYINIIFTILGLTVPRTIYKSTEVHLPLPVTCTDMVATLMDESVTEMTQDSSSISQIVLQQYTITQMDEIFDRM